MRIRKLVPLIIIIFIGIGVIYCQNSSNNFKPDTTELMKFLETLKGKDYEISSEIEYFQGYPEDENKFAKQFYNDFLNGNVKFIAPEYKTDSLKDPKFQQYLEKYPQFEFVNGRVMGEGENAYLINKKYPHYNFRVYQINFDNNENNGIEDVLYSGGYRNDEENYGYSSYDILNLKNKIKSPNYCTKSWMGGKSVEPEYEKKDKERTKNYNGIIKYKDRYYIYEVKDWDVMAIIELYCWRIKKNKCLSILRYKINTEEKTNE